MFIDEAELSIKAGDGGAGAVSWRREKYVDRGGPDGGDGGKGGDVIFVADRGESTLLKFRFKREFEAQRGGYGMGSNCHGKDGEDLVLPVPPGTLIKDSGTGETVADLVEDGQKFIAAKGGIGGKGNAFFKSSTMQAPKFAQPGMPGDGRKLHLELRLLADVGIIGLPNAGKSTLISRLTAAKPKIADYPFTTLSPKIGVVQADNDSFVMADMPGLIEGAHGGKGLGIRFLKHIERTAVLCHLIDVSDPDPERVLRDFTVIENELASFDPGLLERRMFVLLTKIDSLHDRAPLEPLKRMFEEKGFTVLAISSVAGEGMEPLVRQVHAAVKAARVERHRAAAEEEGKNGIAG
ncbi:MAG: GTPase ObgE [Nitrospinae bacterium]|nr:GTPase ObgE [Nitrospinota bacterium]